MVFRNEAYFRNANCSSLNLTFRKITDTKMQSESIICQLCVLHVARRKYYFNLVAEQIIPLVKDSLESGF